MDSVAGVSRSCALVSLLAVALACSGPSGPDDTPPTWTFSADDGEASMVDPGSRAVVRVFCEFSATGPLTGQLWGLSIGNLGSSIGAGASGTAQLEPGPSVSVTGSALFAGSLSADRLGGQAGLRNFAAALPSANRLRLTYTGGSLAVDVRGAREAVPLVDAACR